MMDHIFNQSLIKGVNDGDAQKYLLLVRAAKTEQELKAVVGNFLDAYVISNR